MPWIVAGDFNVIRYASEKLGGNLPNPNHMAEFSDCILDCGLSEIPYSGSPFTWTNNKIWERLDWVLSNANWTNHFTSAKVEHLSHANSDHCPLLITMSTNERNFIPTFRFQNMWTSHHDFDNFILNSWSNTISGPPLIQLWLKLKDIKIKLKKWNKEVFGNLFTKLIEAEKEAKRLEDIYTTSLDPQDRAAYHKAKANLINIHIMEETFWRQKSACKFIKDGDRNTKFYHNLVKNRRNLNWIDKIQPPDGPLLSNLDDIKTSVVNYFEGALGCEDFTLPQRNEMYIPTLVTTVDNENLCSPPSDPEIHKAILDINPDATAGSDGFTSLFFQSQWNTVGLDVCLAVRDFFQGAHLPRYFTSTSITLIPKTQNPSWWSDFRPISLCTTIYKLITKIVSNRLSDIIPRIRYVNSSHLTISHLSFADDIIIFCNGSITSFCRILSFLTQVEEVSGLVVNRTNFTNQKLPFMYLGVPLYVGHKKIVTFEPLIQKIQEKLNGWAAKLLSPGGRIVLIQSEVMSMTNHIFQIHAPPCGHRP
ncbi:hypothetical protein KSP39_PZI023308 [Platanthera zijinensis]|uniref:Reverse transcriptase domain-containing protein n=1 Tax=Platanthera zijinensis TaxID=2320716 RepID=A0AAP0AUG0_9ASPA